MLQPDLEVGQLLDQFLERRQELVQGRIDEAYDHGIAVHGPEQSFKVTALQR